MKRSIQIPALAFVVLLAGSMATAQEDQKQVPVKTDFLGDPLPPHALLRLGTNRFTPAATCIAIALSEDGKTVVSRSSPSVMGWDAETGRSLWTDSSKEAGNVGFSAASYGFRGLCRMPVSGRLAYPFHLGSIRLLDFRTGETETIKLGLGEPFKSIDVSPDEKTIAVGSGKFLLVCDLTGKEKYRIENRPKQNIEARSNGDRLTFGGEFSYARFSPDGKSLALVNSESPATIRILDAATGEIQRKIETKGYVIRLCFSHDSKTVYATEQRIAARAYDVESGSEIWDRLFALPGLDERYTTDIALSPAGNELAVGTAIGEDQRIHLLDPATGETVGTLEGHTWKPWCLEYNADGSQLYSAGWDGVIRRWDIASRQQIRVENAERASGVCSMSPDGKSMAFCDDSGKLHVVDTTTGRKLRTIDLPGTTFSQVIYSEDSQQLAAGGSSQNDIHVYVWNLSSGQELHHWNWPKGRDVHSTVEALSFSRDAQRLAAAVFRQSACYVFDLPTNQQIAQVRHGQVYGLCMRSDGQQFVSAGWDSTIRTWDCETGEVVDEHKIENAGNGDPRMYGALYSPDGQSIAVLRMDTTIGIYTTELELVRNINMGQMNRVVYGSFQYSHNGLWIGVGHMNGIGSVFDAYSGEVVWNEAKHDKYIYNVDFGSDNRSMLTGGEDGVCHLWDLNTIDPAEPADFEKLASDLVGASARDAFVAHQRLVLDPDRAVAAVEGAIQKPFTEGVFVDGQALGKKLFADFTNPDKAVQMTAVKALNELGPDIAAVMSEPNITEEKFVAAVSAHFNLTVEEDINNRYRRAIYLLAELDTPAAGRLLDQMLETSPGLAIKKMVFLGRKHRQRYLQRVGKPAGD